MLVAVNRVDEPKVSPSANRHTKAHPGSYHICCNYQPGGIRTVDSELSQLNTGKCGHGYGCVLASELIF